ncbi:hypothetical protein BLNAU_20097 [Blattamonas nauphoetae]|uniref:Protein kinase domain-containing protein n=1 Tax=Blattamonas nauphoetae TaxID=2049346 RepID=A0ABQ9X0V8_9EUKA|nr:hypothetical protein BLNAU_20097 [Blattamonas nauphoetae]
MPTATLLFFLTGWYSLVTSATTSQAPHVVLLSAVLFGNTDLDDSSSRYTLEPISYECSSFILDSVRLKLEGASPTTIQHSRFYRAHHDDSLSDDAPDWNREQTDMFTIVNSTISFNTLIFDLETTFLGLARSNDLSSQISSSSFRAATVDSSCVSFSNSAFRLGRVVAPIVVSAPNKANPTDTSLTFFSCEIQSHFSIIPSFVEISDPKAIIHSTSVTLASSSVFSQSIASQTGFATATSQQSKLSSLSTSISSSSFVNVTAASNQTPNKHRFPLTQQLIGVDMNRVENGLYGTVSAIFSSSLQFNCRNSTLIECENKMCRNDQSDQSIKHITESPTLSSADGTFTSDPLYTHYHFSDSNITSNTQQASFTIISIPDLAGTVKLTRCTININCTSKHVGVMDLAGQVDANHRLVIDSSTVTYDKAASSFLVQIRLQVEHCWETRGYVHFENNTANEYLTTIGAYAHYRGNDLHCSSDGIATTNGELASQDVLFPAPSGPAVPALFVEEGTIGTESSLEMKQVWFSHVTSLTTAGGSCVDARTSSSVAIISSDAAHCSSSGPAGVFHFTRFGSMNLTLTDIIFTSNQASSSHTSRGNDIVLVNCPPKFLSVTSSVKSISQKPRVLIDGVEEDLQIPNFGYHSHGISYPFNHRFYLAVPMSHFPGIKTTIQDLVSPGSQTSIRVRNILPVYMEEIIIQSRKIEFQRMSLHQNCDDITSQYILKDNAYFGLRVATVTLSKDPKTTPFIVQSSSATLLLSDVTLTLPSTLSHPFLLMHGGVTTLDVYVRKPLTLIACSLYDCRGGSFALRYWAYSNIHSDVNGSVLHAINTTVTFPRVSFTNCSSKNGGVAYIELGRSNYISAYVTGYSDLFKNCSATERDGNGNLIGKGGALFIKGTSKDARPIRLNTTDLNHARFEGNTAAEGNDIFIESSLFEGKTLAQIPVFGGVSMSNEYRVVIDGWSDPAEMELIHFFLPSPTISVNGSVQLPLGGYSGTDGDNCKWTGTHCATLKYGVSHLKQKYKDNTHFPQTIRFVWNMTYTEKDIVISDQDITVKGTTAAKKAEADVLRSILDVDSSIAEGASLFTIKEKARLTVVNLDIRPIAKAGLFCLEDDGDSLELNDVAVICSLFESFRHPLLKSTRQPIRIVDCSFNQTKDSTGRATLSAPLISFSSDTSSLFMSSNTFSSFSVTNHALVEIRSEHPTSILSTSFSDCVRTNPDQAKLILVTSLSLSSILSGTLWEGSFSPDQPLLDFVGRDSSLTSNEKWYETSLMFHLLAPTVKIVAGETGKKEHSEHPKCGSDRLRCSSLESAVTSALTHTLMDSIEVAGTTTLSSSLVVSSSASISSPSSKQVIVQSGVGSITMNGASQTLSFDSLLFQLNSSSAVPTFFIVSAGTLSLRSCEVGTGTQLKMNEQTVSLVQVSNDASLKLDSVYFQNLQFTHPSLGTVIHLSLDTPFSSTTGTLFEGITSNGTGSLIFVETSDLDSTSKQAPFALLKSFIEPPQGRLFTEAEKDEFVGQVGTDSPESMLFFWFPHTNQETTLSVDGEGEDHANCGLTQLPCETLDKGFSSLKRTESTLLVGSSTSLTTSHSTSFAKQTIKSKSEIATINTASSASFSVLVDHALGLNSLAFLFGVDQRSTSFVSVSSGSLSVESCSFGSVATASTLNKALFNVAGSLTIKSSNLTRISTSSSTGLLSIDLSDSHTLSVISTPLISCAASAGPLVSLTLSNSTEQTDWNFDMSGLSFSAASSNVVPSGVLIFVSGPSFATQIVPSRFPAVDLSTVPEAFWGNDTSTDVSSSLLVYLIAAGREIDVDGENGKDIAHCGHFGVSCSTIGKGISRANGEDGSKEIRIVDSTNLNELISPNEHALSLVGQSTTQSVRILEDGGFDVVAASLSLSSLSFTTSVSSFSRSLICVSISGSLSIHSCSFAAFSCSSSASILTASIATQKSVTITNTTFSNCNTTGSTRCGVVDVTMAAGSEFVFTHSGTPFTSCSSLSADANHVFIAHPTLTKEVIESCLNFTWDQTSRTSKDLMGKEGDHRIPIPLALFFASLPKQVFVDAEWCDVSVCGFAEYPCASLSALHSKIASIPDTTITLESSLTHSDELTFSERMSMVGGNNEMRISELSLSPTECGLFTTTADVSFTSLFITVPSTFKHISLIDCQSGCLTMRNCSLSQASSTRIPTVLIELHSDASLSISESFFTSITSSHPKASVISAVLSEKGSLHVDNNTFSCCSCSGEAHSIFMSLSNSSEVHVNSFDYSLTSLVFSSPSSNSESTPSIDVLVIGRHLDRTVTLDRWEKSFSLENGESIWGDDKTTGMNTSLLPYLVSISGAVEVDWKGFSFEKCGHFFLFCSSFELGVARMEEADLNRIKIIEKIEVSSTIQMKGGNCVVGASVESILCFSKDGQFENSAKESVDSSLSFSSLVITIERLERTTPLFVSTSGSLSFTSCSFIGTQSPTISFPLILIRNGELEMSEIEAEDITLESDALIVSDGSVSISKSNFTSINRETGLGCVLESESENEVRVVNTSFIQCNSAKTRTWIVLHGANGKTLKVENWEGTLDRFSPRPSVLLDDSSDTDSTSSLLSDESGAHSLLYEFYPRVSGEIVVSLGEVNEDHRLCGSWELPCLTVDDSVWKTGVRKVEIFGSSWMKSLMKMDGDLLWICGHKKKGILKMIGSSRIVNNLFDDPDTLLLSFVTVDLSDSTLSSSDSLILNENGEVSIDSSTIWSKNEISFSLIRLTGGEASVTNLTLSDLTFSSLLFGLSSSDLCSFSEVFVSDTRMPSFLTVSDTKRLVLKSFSFDGSSSGASSSEITKKNGEVSEEEKDVCEWTEAMIRVVNTTSIVENVKVSHVGSGGIWLDGGSMKVEASTFHDNFVSNSSFPSVRRNMHCSNGELNVESLSGGDGGTELSKSAWISVGEECIFSSSVVDVRSPLFIASLSGSKSKVSTNSKAKTFTAELVGSLLIPCGLWVEVFEWNEKTKRETGKVDVDLSKASIEKWNETSLTLTLSEDTLRKSLDTEQEWRLRVMFGSGVGGEDWVRVKMSAVAKRKAQAVESLKWVIPVAAGVIVVIVVVLIVIVCCRRKMKTKSTEKEELMAHQELDCVDEKMFVDESVNIMGDRTGNHLRPTTLNGTHNVTGGNDGATTGNEQNDKARERDEDPLKSAQFLCEALKCGDKFEVCIVDKRQTLHDRIHKPMPGARPLGRFNVESQIVEGLKRLDRDARHRWILGRLNPQWILIDKNDQVFLKVESEDPVPPDKAIPLQTDTIENATAHEQAQIVNQTMRRQVVNENLQRWIAPELGEEEGRGTKEGMEMKGANLTAASVFSLGLVLYEIETGNVPFGEIDGVNAHRQLGTGSRPKMENIPEEMKELISSCLNVNALERPSLDAISERLIWIGKNTSQLTSEEAHSLEEERKKQRLVAKT